MRVHLLVGFFAGRVYFPSFRAATSNIKALLNYPEKVCRHHASRGLAVLLRHGVGSCAPSADVASRIMEISSTNDGSNVQGNIEKGACITFGDEQSQPWRVVQTWLGLRHDLAAVALLQVGFLVVHD